ncbi:ArnT family glycosyltransferase [Salaquimonas pukyongi]|uniref:ArnT family glycosyltransferase n=1 Tax=Salaquimonas pukyongi TaxID=2712698 RepID=UPI00096B8DD8|nr:glycosyltransferase family 39 protein [Salaquimonas pukyongi]
MNTIHAEGQHAGSASVMARRFWLVAALILLVRLVSLWFNSAPLFFDEAQYWVWAKEPAFGYFSKPPLLAFVIAAFTGVCGDSEFCVRLASPVLHTLTGFFVFLCGAALFNARIALVAGIGWLLLPAVSLSATLVSTDVPLLLCWSAALWALICYRQDRHAKWLFVLAIAFGLGLNAKYAMAYFALCFVLFGMLSKEGRGLLKDWKLWTAFAAGLAFLIPNVVWQSQNQFTTVTHTGDNIGWGGHFPNLAGLGEFIGSQFAVAGPIVFAVYLIALIRLWREGASSEQKLLIAFSLPVLVLISFQAIMSKAFANWAATAFPAALLLVSELFIRRMPQLWMRLSNGIHWAVFAAIAVLVGFAGPGQLPLSEKQNPFSRMWGGPELAAGVGEVARAEGIANVLSGSRKRSATLIYYLREEPLTVYAWREGNGPGDHFELTRALQDRPDLQGEDFIFPTSSPGVPEAVASRFTTVRLAGEIPEYAGSDKQRRIFVLKGYRP